MPTIHELVLNATEDLKDRLEKGEEIKEDNAHDIIHEIAEGYVPMYNYQLLEVAMSDLRLACSEPQS